MPREARKKSESGIYHVMMRGINKQTVFEDEKDNIQFLKILKDYKEKSGYKLFAYSLMGNHVHLLIKVEKEELEQIFKRIGATYVYWYNYKYNRLGHLFQDRYKSEPIENDSYFLTVLRYIHQNPVKAGLCQKAGQYEWSSFHEYVNHTEIADVEYGLSLFDCNRQKAVKLFIEYTEQAVVDTCCLELEQKNRNIHDEEAKKIINEVCGAANASDFQKIDTLNRDKSIAALKKRGLSIRQISRLTGVSFGVVRRK